MKYRRIISATAIIVASFLACGFFTKAFAKAPAAYTMDDLRRVIATGLSSGQRTIIVPHGIYRGAAPAGGNVCLTLNNVSNVNIIGVGVTMICTDLGRAIEFERCSDVSLTGMTVDYDPLPFTQGQIIDVSPAESWLDVKIDAGYAVRAQARIDVVDPATRFRRRDMPFMWDTTAEVRPGGIVRIHSKTTAGFARVGDLASLGGDIVGQPYKIVHTIAIDDCARITLNDVTVCSSNCMGIVAAGGNGGHQFLNCRVVPGPPPAGATEPRILSTDADGILTSSMKYGALTKGCEIRDCGDDSWSVQSSDCVVLKSDGNTVYFTSRDDMAAEPGDRLQTSLGAPILTIKSMADVSRSTAGIDPSIISKIDDPGRSDFWKLRASVSDGNIVKADLAGGAAWSAGTSFYDIDRQGNGFDFRNNNVHSSGRILIKASGTVEDNVIDSPYCISVQPEVPPGAAAGIAHLVIRGNKVINAHSADQASWMPQMGAIAVSDGRAEHLQPAGVFGLVEILNNTIIGGNGAAIGVTSADNVIIRGNVIRDVQQIKPGPTGTGLGMDNNAIVYLANCNDVTLAGNHIINAGPFISKALVCGPNVNSVTGALDSGH
jgi:hypothetical protein